MTRSAHTAPASTPPLAPATAKSKPENPTTPNYSTAVPQISAPPGRMNGYCNLASSPPVGSGGVSRPAEEEGKWEGVAVGAATLARNISSASQRFRAVERSKSTSGHRGGGLQAVVRRAFSMRRQPASSFSEGYWRIHDGVDGDDDDDAADQAEQQQELAVPEELAGVGEDQKKGAAEQQDAANNREIKGSKKKRGHILKACKKLLGF